MIALGKGVCGDEQVAVSQQYLARIGERYLVVTPIDPTGSSRPELPYTEAAFIDPVDRQQKPFTEIHDIAPIF